MQRQSAFITITITIIVVTVIASAARLRPLAQSENSALLFIF